MAKVYCESCKKRCRGNVLKVTDFFFHKECFRCTKCNISLETGGFFRRNDEFYCQEDFHLIPNPRCKVCDLNLSGEIISAFSFSFHKNCFTCRNCKSSFRPGDRVTVCDNEFFCTFCSVNLTDDMKIAHKHSLSFADQATSQSKHVINRNGCVQNSNNQKSQSTKSKILKSSLRHSENRLDPPPGDHGYMSADSDAGDAIFSPEHGGIFNTPVSPFADTEKRSYPASRTSNTINSENRPRQNGVANISVSYGADIRDRFQPASPRKSKSLHSDNLQPANHYPGGHPLSEYGPFSYLSSTSIRDQPLRHSSDLYRRGGTNTASLASSVSKLHHFHVPEGPSRFSSGQSRFRRNGNFHVSSLEGALTRSVATTRTRKNDIKSNTGDFKCREIQTSPSQLISNGLAKSVPLNSSPVDTIDPEMSKSCHIDTETSLEARKLASYPAGHPRDMNIPPAIDRYDWPAPACTAVILAELMRERRQRRRNEARISGSIDNDDSQEELSLDTSIGSPSESVANMAINLEEEQKCHKYKSQLRLDPISASRSPNANIEPPFKTRYATHSFASPSRESQKSSHINHRLGYSLDFINSGNRGWTGDSLAHSIKETVRPGYTEGKLTMYSVTSSLPATSLFSYLDTYRPASEKEYNDCEKLADISQHDSIRKIGPAYYSFVGKSDPYRLNATGDTSTKDMFGLANCDFTYPTVLPSMLSYTVSKFSSPEPNQEHSYDELIAYEGRFPQGIDRMKLETYLSDVEFESVLGLTRIAFYRLPEWKRNDLKRRVRLF